MHKNLFEDLLGKINQNGSMPVMGGIIGFTDDDDARRTGICLANFVNSLLADDETKENLIEFLEKIVTTIDNSPWTCNNDDDEDDDDSLTNEEEKAVEDFLKQEKQVNVKKHREWDLGNDGIVAFTYADKQIKLGAYYNSVSEVMEKDVDIYHTIPLFSYPSTIYDDFNEKQAEMLIQVINEEVVTYAKNLFDNYNRLYKFLTKGRVKVSYDVVNGEMKNLNINCYTL